MLNRHLIAVASVILFGVSPSFAVRQSEQSDKGKQIRQYLKIQGERPALIAFMDFQCPACQKNWPAIKAALKRHPDVKFYPVSFPLVNQHKNAFDAAVAYEVAKGSGAGMRVYETLLSGKQNLDPASLNQCLRSHRLAPVLGTAKAAAYATKVDEQLKFATALGISKTPTLILIDAKGAATEISAADMLDARLP